MLDPQTLFLIIQIVAGLAVASLAYAVVYPFINEEDKTKERISTYTVSRAVKIAANNEAEVTANRRKQVSESLKEIERRQKESEKVTLRLRLIRAGLNITPRTFWISSAIFGVSAAAIVFVSLERTPLTMIGSLVVGFVAMFGVPRWILGKMTKRRLDKFLNELANAMDIIVRGIKSGLPLNECLQIIARESPDPIGPEFREIVEQQRVGVTLGEALDRLAQRVPLPEVRFLGIVIAIQQQSGGNLSEALSNLSGVLRERLKMKLKVKALSAEATASAGVLACLPPGVTVLLGTVSPKFIAPLFNTQTGNFYILIGVVLMTIGVLVMRKMINFKF